MDEVDVGNLLSETDLLIGFGDGGGECWTNPVLLDRDESGVLLKEGILDGDTDLDDLSAAAVVAAVVGWEQYYKSFISAQPKVPFVNCG